MIDLSDPISRQQAITALRALSDEDGYISAPHEVVTDVVRGLPPVRAEHKQTTQSEQGDSDKFGVKTSETCEDCISRQAAIDAAREELESGTYFDIPSKIEALPPAQPEIVRCKDCKHKPSGDGVNHRITFPDERCPCQCDDSWYSWVPRDDWFCGNAERRTDERAD